MKNLLAYILVATSFLSASEERDWENWKDGDVSEIIHRYWLHSDSELNHRKILAQLVEGIYSPGERFLEAGCGSGLVYRELVPKVMGNAYYTGIDVTQNMLAIASKDYPEGTFLEDDLYRLSFEDKSFEIVAAFEVLGHIRDIKVPIQEMLRVASKKVIFTVWTSDSTQITEERFKNSLFLHTAFSHEDIMNIINEVTDSSDCLCIESYFINPNIRAYIITIPSSASK